MMTLTCRSKQCQSSGGKRVTSKWKCVLPGWRFLCGAAAIQQKGADEGVQVAVEDRLHVAGLVVGAATGPAIASQAYRIGWQAAHWDTLPQLPARSAPGQLATLAATAAGVPEALVVNRGTLTVWQLGSGQWTLVQTVRVAIPYGSSG